MHYSLHLDEQFTVVFMTVNHSAQMLLKLEKCIPISHVTLETVPKYANIKRPTSSQLYASEKLYLFIVYHAYYKMKLNKMFCLSMRSVELFLNGLPWGIKCLTDIIHFIR